MDKVWYKTYFGTEAQEIVVYRDVLDRIYIVADNPPDVHNCDQMGCASLGPHIVAVYLNANKYHSLQAENETIRNQWHIDQNDKVELQAENKGLREALEPFANFACDDWKTHKCFNCIAKQALEGNQ